jgi:cell division protein FtsN
MAQGRRGKTQARRSGGNGGLPGWAWLVIGIALTLLLVIAVPRLIRPGEDGFFRNAPKPNPDAQPQPVDEEAVVEADTDTGAGRATPATPRDPPQKKSEFDFYTLLPGEEVPVSDAEIAATEQAERRRAEQQARAEASPALPSDPALDPARAQPLPQPVDELAPAVAAVPPAATPPSRPEPAPPVPGDDSRYLLQAGAFEASGQAEELKARIAMLGLGARVESARIGERTVYRVRMGPYGTASELAEARRKLAAGGLAAMAVKVN